MDTLQELSTAGVSTARLLAAAEAKLEAGTQPAEVFSLVAREDLIGTEGFDALEALLLQHGLHPDSPVGGSYSYLHYRLASEHPPPCRPCEGVQVTLEDLLALGPNPDLRTASGATALHLMVERLLKRCAPPHLAGFSPTAPDATGVTVVQLFKARYAELCRLADGLRSMEGDTGHCDLRAAIRQSLELCGEKAPLPPAATAAAAAAAAAPPADPAAPAPELWTAKMPLGKYGVRRLTELPGSYLGWMCREPGFFESSPQTRELRERLLALGLVRHEAGGLVVVAPDSHAARMPFGKYHEILLALVPADYLAWMCRVDVGFFDGSPVKVELLRHLVQLGRVRQVGNLVVPCMRQLRYGPYDEDWYPEDYDDYYYTGEEYEEYEEYDDAGV
ncbi:hypothetical protein TSOC_006033 [Tetrabaena socialis]|uniref:Uncharacterized protein n=1 Tax=Tetrabaena socialis TaxID=47790 RepID=A0A2J8A4R7_9CHLO|nr:hypothetical protein TSOC_006033 [Tetrabaena socialis]|eukprot:PNH07511.1 hypothetical protein TSOC_006033 [Tetrabaena socialis]